VLKITEDTFTENSPYILTEASRRYGISASDLHRLGSFESFIFDFKRNGEDFILRINPATNHSTNLIRGELEWIDYLADNGVSACRPLPSTNGSLTEVVKLDNIDEDPEAYYTLTAFARAAGGTAGKDDWNDKLFIEWGRVIGRMHALTKNYTPSDPSFTRPTWHEDDDLRADKYLPASQTEVLRKYADLLEHLHALPTDRESYGLVHEDMHHGNFYVNSGHITIFDFDDCQYHWFAADISIPLFYVMRNTKLNDRSPQFAKRFFSCLLEGYHRENSINSSWLEEIHWFLKLREMILYIIIYAEDAHQLNGWCRDFMKDRRYRIENDIPVIDIDFGRFG
jgi:Ser/Thr protein kinase RdoA (MazF antagonist)